MAENTSPATDTNLPPWLREPEPPPKLTPAVVDSYNANHDKVLRWLLILLAFVLSCFPINESSIYHSLRVGQMVVSGEFPFGSDPFGYGNGDAGWVHTGWLGDVVFYWMYWLGGGPLLILFRATLIATTFGIAASFFRKDKDNLLGLFTLLCGVLVVVSRLWMRTELFSLLGIVLTLRILYAGSVPVKSMFHGLANRLSRGKWWLLLPAIFALWVNLDSWFFLGPVILLLYLAASYIQSNSEIALPTEDRKRLSILVGIAIAATLINPFLFKVYLKLPADLSSTAQAKMAEMVPETNQSFNVTHPFTSKFWESTKTRTRVLERGEMLPLGLALSYPGGLSFSEWAYFPYMILLLVSFCFGDNYRRLDRVLITLMVLILTCSQFRHANMLVAATLPLAIINWAQLRSVAVTVSRGNVVWGSLVRMAMIFGIIILGLMMLMPVPDTLGVNGYVHPRGSFGFSLRQDKAYRAAIQKIHDWRATGKIEGNSYFLDYIDLPAYSAWFAPGSTALFDRRLAPHAKSVEPFFTASKALRSMDPKKLMEPVEATKARQAGWREVFTKYGISHLVTKSISIGTDLDLISVLLLEREPDTGRPSFQMLKHTEGMVYILAWTGSPHYSKLSSLVYDAEKEVFVDGRVHETVTPPRQVTAWEAYISGEPARYLPSFEAHEMYKQFARFDPRFQLPIGVQGVPIMLEPRFQFIYTQGNTELFSYPFKVLAHLGASGQGLSFPIVPSVRNVSIAPQILALNAANKGVAEAMAISDFDPRSNLLRFQAFSKLAAAHQTLLDYETLFAPGTTQVRESLTLMSLQNACIYGLATMENVSGAQIGNRAEQLVNFNLRVASMLLNRGVIDDAVEHFRFARALLTQVIAAADPNQEAKFTAELPNRIKQMTGVDFVMVEKRLMEMQAAWKEHIKTQSASSEANTVAVLMQRAAMANQSGLVREAHDIYRGILQGNPNAPSAAIAGFIEVLAKMGKVDQISFGLLNRIRGEISENEYLLFAGINAMARGDAATAASLFRQQRTMLDQQMRESLLESQFQHVFGTTSQPNVSMLLSTSYMTMQTAGSSYNLSDLLVKEALSLVEAGAPKEAEKLFYQAIVEVEPNSPWKPLVNKYYSQITGKLLP